LTDNLNTKTGECEDLDAKNKDLEAKIKDVEKELADAREEHQEATESARIAHENYKQETQSVIDSRNGKITLLESAKADLEEKLDASQTHDAAMTERAALVEPLERNLANHLEQIVQLKNIVIVHEKAQSALTSKAALLAEAKAEREAELEKLRRDLSDAQMDNVKYMNEHEEDLMRHNTYDARLEELKTLITSVSLNMNGWSIDSAMKEGKRSAAQAKIAEEKKE